MIHDFKFLGVNHKIASNGNLSLRQSWLIASDAITELESYQEARVWAGNIGDFFRYPNDDYSDYSYDKEVVVTNIEIKPINDAFTFEIVFSHEYNEIIDKVSNSNSNINDSDTNGDSETGDFDPELPEQIILKSKKISESIDGFNNKVRCFSYQYYGDLNRYSTPNIGDIFSINNENFICSKVVKKTEGEYKFSIEIEGKLIAVPLKLLSEKNYNVNEEKKISYFVTLEYIDEFLSSLEVGKAIALAGDNFYLTSYQITDEGSIGKSVEIQCKKIMTRILEHSKEEEIIGFYAGETPNRQLIYKSKWQVKANDIHKFNNITGNSASSWAESNTIVTKVKPTKISDIEYQVDIEAQSLNNTNLYDKFDFDDYSSLSSRTDYKLRIVDFHIKPKECGFYLRSDGNFIEIPDWNAEYECPFVTSMPLGNNMINAVIKIIEITEITYKRNSINTNMKHLIEWAKTRLFTGSICGVESVYLKANMAVDEIYDNRGNKWTKCTRVYHSSPNFYNWNELYWLAK